MSLWLDLLGASVRFIETPTFGSTRIVEAGVGNPEALFLLHGFGGHLEAYARNVMALAADYHVIAFDFVGHGLSNKPLDIEYLPDTYARQLSELMDAMGVLQAHLCGESLGGWVAGKFAAVFPFRVKRLVLSTTSGIPNAAERGKRGLPMLSELNHINSGQTPTIQAVRGQMQWLLHESNWNLLSDELVGLRHAFYLHADYLQSEPRVLELLRSVEPGSDVSLMLEPSKLTCDTLFLWTRFNPVHDLAAASAACELAANGHLYVMEAHAAQWPQYEAPSEFNAVVRQFLRDGKV